jgi:hypothetical protein
VRPAAFLQCALLLFACSRICLGAQADAQPKGRHVELLIGSTSNEANLLEASIREMLTAKHLAVLTKRTTVVTAQDLAAAIAPPEESTPSVARVLLDFTAPEQATLFLIDPRRGRVFVRRMPLAHGLDAVARASARFVVEQSIDAILEGRDIGVSREEFQRSILPRPTVSEAPPPPAVAAPAPAPPAPAPQAPARTQIHLSLAGGYEIVAMGSSEYQQAAKIEVAGRFARLQVAVAGRLAAPMTVSGDGAEARLSTGGFGVSVAGRLLNAGDLSVLAGLGGGLDLTRVAPAVTTPGLQPESAFWAPAPWVAPFAKLEWLFGRISVAVGVGAEIHPLAERYTVRNSGGTADVFVPWRLRPAAAVLVGVVF